MKIQVFFVSLFMLVYVTEAQFDFDYLVYAQVWAPTLCEFEHCTVVPEEGRFLFHGLWPTQLRDFLKPDFCNPENAALFDPDHRPELDGLESDMRAFWPSLTSGNRVFWEAQWAKHGTCSTWSRGRYIRTIIDFYRNDDLFSILRLNGISPVDESMPEQYHFRTDVEQAIRNAYGPIVGNADNLIIGLDCKMGDHFYQARICKTSDNLQYRNCPNTGTCGHKFRFLTYHGKEQQQTQPRRVLKKVLKIASKPGSKLSLNSPPTKIEPKNSIAKDSYFAILNDLHDAAIFHVSNEAPKNSTNFMEKIQKDIYPSMRAILIDWLVEVAEEYIDRYLSRNAMNRQQLQLLGVASMMIASNYEQIRVPQAFQKELTRRISSWIISQLSKFITQALCVSMDQHQPVCAAFVQQLMEFHQPVLESLLRDALLRDAID